MPGALVGCYADMFIGDEVRVQVSVAAAAARLANLIGGGSLIEASHEAWGEGIARVGPLPGISKLVTVQFLEPVQRGAVTTLALRWQATGVAGRLFPVLDANLTLAAHGDQAAVLGLDGVYGPPGGYLGAGLDRAILHRLAEATIRSFLLRIADAIVEPAPAVGPSRRSGILEITPDRLTPDSA